MTANTCNCGKPIPDTGHICWPCTSQLRATISAIRTLARELPTTAAHGTQTGPRTGTIGRAPSAGINIGAISASETAWQIVTSWLRLMDEEHVIDLGNLPLVTFDQRVSVLLLNTGKIRTHETAFDCLSELQDLERLITRSVDRKPDINAKIVDAAIAAGADPLAAWLPIRLAVQVARIIGHVDIPLRTAQRWASSGRILTRTIDDTAHVMPHSLIDIRDTPSVESA